jgi:hypothetical protein
VAAKDDRKTYFGEYPADSAVLFKKKRSESLQRLKISAASVDLRSFEVVGTYSVLLLY